MTRYRLIYVALILAALGLNTGPTGEWGLVYAQEPAKAEMLRPEVAKALQEAQELLKAQKHKEALAKIAEADSASDKTAFDTFYINRIRGAVAIASGDNELAVKSIEAVFETGRLSAADQLKLIEALADSHFGAKNYAKAASWAARYFKEGGSEAKMRALLIQSYYSGNDFLNAARELQTAIQADEKAGQAPAESQLQMLASTYQKQNDNAGYAAVLEKLVTYYPKKDYWADLIKRTLQGPGFADRLSLDTYRLLLATGNMSTAANFTDMAQIALNAGFPIEGKKILDQGFASGVLGTGSEAGHHKQLRDQMSKQAADDQKALDRDAVGAVTAQDGTGLVNVGFTYVSNGQFDKGLAMMEQGISKGGLKNPEDAKLHLGIAYLMVGQKPKAIQMFKTVQGADGTAELARLWILHAPRYAS
jgi:hypothetical protein